MTAEEMSKLEKKRIKELPDSIRLLTKPEDIEYIQNVFESAKEFKSFFVEFESVTLKGNWKADKIKQVWGFYGTIPYEDKTAYRLI